MPLTQGQRQRLEQRRTMLQRELATRSTLIERLRAAIAIENDVAHKFQMEKQLENYESEATPIEQELDQIEEQLAPAQQLAQDSGSSEKAITTQYPARSLRSDVSEEDIRFQQRQLQQYRSNLRHYLNQSGGFGGTSQIPVHIFNGIKEQRQEIERIKKILRGWGMEVVDYPEDEE